ncbi:CHASE3 domain-containing protein [Actimicrobium sp. CCC2.4]|uniref:sensor histidine kinase n=1 Tax=Actimicrobium sp. CCC2.4 TaxID=3048606 RepID=UPI002AC992CC|nr:CHASE3 domain-containing protein [Actimicrobium sp. CCC2.4]MEB0135026.1 CHASE3 domain-containing protein [Actimicrobium sp. CCC2.4]WPX31926.1 CHASE3 domain-containing protein [Actimicrobium sp. CCC2.4]
MAAYAPRFPVPSLAVVGIVSTLLALTLTTVVSLSSMREFKQRAAIVVHTNDVINRIDGISALMTDAQSAVRGYVISGDETFLVPYRAAIDALPLQLTELNGLMAGKPAPLRDLATLATLAHASLAIGARVVQTRRSDAGAAMDLVTSGAGDQIQNRIRAQAQRMTAAGQTLLAERESAAADSAARASLLVALGALTGALISGAAFLLLRVENRKRRSADIALAEANNVLMQRACQLEATNRELESFSYSVSHDLRIPLRAVSGYARMFEEDYGDRVDSEGLRLLAVIRDNSKRMGDLIDDLLAFSRFGRQAMQQERIDMRAVVDTAIRLVRRDGEEVPVQIEIGNLPRAVGDPALLQQVWVNLLSNAVKYSAMRDQPVIRISGIDTLTGTVYSIADNGVGFDMQYYGKLFGVFQRLHSADQFPGTGVGLAIAQRIVTRHGGRIWAEAVVDQGATFYFALPKQESIP